MVKKFADIMYGGIYGAVGEANGLEFKNQAQISLGRPKLRSRSEVHGCIRSHITLFK